MGICSSDDSRDRRIPNAKLARYYHRQYTVAPIAELSFREACESLPKASQHFGTRVGSTICIRQDFATPIGQFLD